MFFAFAFACGSGPLLCMAVTSLNLSLNFKIYIYCIIDNINTSRGIEMFQKLYEIFPLFVNITIACIYFGSAIKYSVLWMEYS